jgi:hypothetical protein
MDTPHPMILPLAGREEGASLNAREKNVFDILYDAAEGFCADPPVWNEQRHHVQIGREVYSSASLELVSPGWRQFSTLSSLPLSDQFPDSTATPCQSPVPGEAQIAGGGLCACESQWDDNCLLLEIMASSRIGRPSTYGNIFKKLSEKGIMVNDGKRLHLTEHGNQVLSKLDNACPKFNQEFCRLFESKLDEIAKNAGTETPASFLKWAIGAESSEKLAAHVESLDLFGEPPEYPKFEFGECEQTNLWEGSELPPGIDPERIFGLDHPLRKEKQKLHLLAVGQSDGKWDEMTPEEKTERKIGILAKGTEPATDAWKETNRFNLIQRWLVDWNP